MFNLFISYASILAYIAFSVDLLMQILKIHKRKSSDDVSPWGVGTRLVGSTALFVKFFTVQDPFLIIGQGLFSLTILAYLLTVVYFKSKDAALETAE
ncbi:PQ-loop repeat-containing protein [candidate division WS5 bacterium]|uniref:PQ-loop repeat-containing protein n=1 Tax=candidate division WS5 bacterium TaxID=2093353 RepID=A0A419DA70_9BACT|nr:MAG: PQ-loop repeat-containing protein [candidate division WS5 bacterium]